MIPDYQSIMLPLLKLLSQEGRVSTRSQVEQLAGQFELTDDEQAELLPSGVQPVFANRVGWAGTYMLKAGLVQRPKRGELEITDVGREALASNPAQIDVSFLMQYETFREFRAPNGKKKKSDSLNENGTTSSATSTSTMSPLEQLESAHAQIQEDLLEELKQRISDVTPQFFENLVVKVLVGLGYGGDFRDAARSVGKSHDGGIDGIIKEDRLGLEKIFVQAKCWKDSVGGPEIQKFAGALMGKNATKGVFITSSHFTSEAIKYAEKVSTNIILIDGIQLAKYMAETGIGVTTVAQYRIAKVDGDFFE